jgi:hypothetical protein
LEGRYIITDVDLNTGEPLLPTKNAKKFINRCGVLVRDKLLISTREWKVKKDDRNISLVSERDKDLLWLSVTAHFQLPGGEDLKELVKSWALNKMATQFQT